MTTRRAEFIRKSRNHAHYIGMPEEGVNLKKNHSIRALANSLATLMISSTNFL